MTVVGAATGAEEGRRNEVLAMDKSEKAQDDLRYLRGLAQGVEGARAPASILLLWAVVSLVGFPIIDFAPHAARWYWMVSAPVATGLTALIAIRSQRRLGQLDRTKGGRHLAHWLGLFVAVNLAVLSGHSGAIAERAIPTVVLLILAFGFWTAGVHLERPLRWVSLLMLVGYLLVISRWVPYPWTLLGLAVGLVAAFYGGYRMLMEALYGDRDRGGGGH